jgi:hypothetical protein
MLGCLSFGGTKFMMNNSCDIEKSRPAWFILLLL